MQHCKSITLKEFFKKSLLIQFHSIFSVTLLLVPSAAFCITDFLIFLLSFIFFFLNSIILYYSGSSNPLLLCPINLKHLSHSRWFFPISSNSYLKLHVQPSFPVSRWQDDDHHISISPYFSVHYFRDIEESVHCNNSAWKFYRYFKFFLSLLFKSVFPPIFCLDCEYHHQSRILSHLRYDISSFSQFCFSICSLSLKSIILVTFHFSFYSISLVHSPSFLPLFLFLSSFLSVLGKYITIVS